MVGGTPTTEEGMKKDLLYEIEKAPRDRRFLFALEWRAREIKKFTTFVNDEKDFGFDDDSEFGGDGAE